MKVKINKISSRSESAARELEIKNVSSRSGSVDILKGIDISIERGRRLSLLGPSGCGKTTLLHIISGLEKPHAGEIIFRGKNMAAVAPHKRNFGMMFQDFALFPHRNVFKNISFGLEMKRMSKRNIELRVHEMLELVNLEGYGKRGIKGLSGGERQRVALARTLAPSPVLMMLDEPLGSLDRLLRERLLADLCVILDKTRITTILVTHDQNEAFAASDLVCVMDEGRVAQMDVPKRLYRYPASRRVANFLGFQNFMTGMLRGNGEIVIPDFFDGHAAGHALFCGPPFASVSLSNSVPPPNFVPLSNCVSPLESDTIQRCTVSDDDSNFICDQNVDILLMPDAATIISENDFLNQRCNVISGITGDVFFMGSLSRIAVKISQDRTFFFNISGWNLLPDRGERIFMRIDPDGIIILNGCGHYKME